MKHGQHEARIAEQARRMGMPLPDAIANKPELVLGLEMYWRAFWELSTDRAIGMAEGPIPWSSMNRYAIRYGLHDEDYDRFVLIIKGMDREYIGYRNAENNKKTRKPKKTSSSMRSR
jgi:hypothetical protein